ncbi:MAG: type II toxin-antitoxin system antitoxin SocA domain-containing protein [Pseudomonadota bacterium]
MSKPHDSRAVANKILRVARSKGIELTLMQLIKLVYLAHGWWLAFSDGEALTSTQAQAWQYGPVHPEVYRAFKRHGAQPISSPATDPLTGLEYSADFSDEQNSIIDAVVEGYGRTHAFRLSNVMHKPGTPWRVTYDKHGYYHPIANSLIKEHFDDLKRRRSEQKAN